MRREELISEFRQQAAAMRYAAERCLLHAVEFESRAKSHEESASLLTRNIKRTSRTFKK